MAKCVVMKTLAQLCLCACVLWGCPDPDPDPVDAGTTPMDAGPCAFTEDPPPDPRPRTPRWAFEPWISKDISNGPDTYDFVNGFTSRDIPVGVVVLDSPWETNYNTFVPNPARYPEFARMVAELKAQDIRTVLWVTQMINESSFDAELGGDIYDGPAENLAVASRCNFLVNDGEMYLWWKGNGAGLDFFNPAARAWWHRLQNTVLDVGVAGFKLDFGEDYIPTATITTAGGTVTHQAYSEAYYRDFLAYGQHRLGADEFVTMVRPYDKSYQFQGRFYARPEHAPVAWVGDNRRDWIGLEDALDHVFRSARAGYAVLGSDIGGYLDKDDQDLGGPTIPFSQANLARWTAVGALMPFMQLHGRANITPWTVPERPDETVTLYRYWSKFHHALVPFFYSLAMAAHAGGPVILHPIGDEPSWPGDWRFMVGDALLVAPILDDTGIRDVVLPAGAGFEDWWDATRVVPGGTTVTAYDATDRARIPLWVAQGAILPMELADDALGFGSAAHAGHLTVLAWPDTTRASFTLTEHDDTTTTITTQRTATGVDVQLTRVVQPVLARIRTQATPSGVTVGGQVVPARASKAELDASTSGWAVDGTQPFVWVRIPAGTSAVTVEVTGG